MLNIDFVGGTTVKVRIWLTIINGKYKDLGKFKGGPWQKKSTYTILTPINDGH
jgi:hypothetical protein